MYIDAQGLFSDNQALTSTAVATNVIDLGATNTLKKYFDGEELVVAISVDVAADAASGDETYAFGIETDDNTGLSSPTVLVSRSISRTALTVNSLHVIPIPMGQDVERYLGVRYTLGGTTPSITVTTYLIPSSGLDKFKPYSKGYTIS